MHEKHTTKNCTYKWSSWWWAHDVRNKQKTPRIELKLWFEKCAFCWFALHNKEEYLVLSSVQHPQGFTTNVTFDCFHSSSSSSSPPPPPPSSPPPPHPSSSSSSSSPPPPSLSPPPPHPSSSSSSFSSFYFFFFLFYGALSRFRAIASSMPVFRNSFYEEMMLALSPAPTRRARVTLLVHHLSRNLSEMCGPASRQLLAPKFSFLLIELNALLHDDVYDRIIHSRKNL